MIAVWNEFSTSGLHNSSLYECINFTLYALICLCIISTESTRPVRAGRAAAAATGKAKAKPAAKKPVAKKAAGGAKKRSAAHSSEDEGSDGQSASENDSEGEAPVSKAPVKGIHMLMLFVWCFLSLQHLCKQPPHV